MTERQKLIQRIVKNAIICALYVVLTFVSYPIAFSGIQFRVSEILVLLCFFNRDYVIGITLGCFLTNLASPFMPWDLLIGTGATLVAALGLSFAKHLGIALLLPIVSNSFLVAIEYVFFAETKVAYWIAVGEIAIGEVSMILIGYIIILLIMKKPKIQEIFGVKRNQDFKW